MSQDADRMAQAAAAASGRRLLTLTAGPPAAGGTFVSRHEGRVVFVRGTTPGETITARSEEHTSELQSRGHLVCRLLLEKKKHQTAQPSRTTYPIHAAPPAQT